MQAAESSDNSVEWWEVKLPEYKSNKLAMAYSAPARLWTRTVVIGEEAAGASDLQQEWKRGEAMGTREDSGTLTR